MEPNSMSVLPEYQVKSQVTVVKLKPTLDNICHSHNKSKTRTSLKEVCEDKLNSQKKNHVSICLLIDSNVERI